MKLALFVFGLLASIVSNSQSTYYIRADSTRLEKVGGNNELILLNGTRSRTGAYLKNGLNGRTLFSYAGDSISVSGTDLILWRGGGTQNVTVTMPGGLPSLTDGKVWIGNGSNVATERNFSGDFTVNNIGAATLATVNGNVGTFTNMTATVNGKGLITAASSGSAPEVPLTFSNGVTRTVNNVTNDLITGIAGGQTVIGGTGVGDQLIFKPTTGVGTTTVEGLIFNVGNNGATKSAAVLNTGQWGIGTGTTASATYGLTVRQPTDATDDLALRLLANNGSTSLTLGYGRISSPGQLKLEGLTGMVLRGTASGVKMNMTAGGLFFFNGSSTPTRSVDILAGTTAIAPLGLNSGALLATPLAGTIEFLTDAYYGTITTGAARRQFAFTTDIPAGGTYILNQTGQQASSNFNISGTGIAPTVAGSDAANGDIIINGTTHATKTSSYIAMQPSGGSVGIGTATPVSILEVKDSNPVALTLTSTGSTAGLILDGGGSFGNYGIYTTNIGGAPGLAIYDQDAGAYRWGITNAGHFIAATDNTYSIGLASTFRPSTINLGTSGIAPLFNATTGFQVAGAAASRKMLAGNGTNFIPSTETWAVPGTAGNVLYSDGTNWTAVSSSTIGRRFGVSGEDATATQDRAFDIAAQQFNIKSTYYNDGFSGFYMAGSYPLIAMGGGPNGTVIAMRDDTKYIRQTADSILLQATVKVTNLLKLGDNNTNQAGELRFYEDFDFGINYVSLKSPSLAANTIYTLPNAYPAVTGYVLSSTDAGIWSWIPATGSLTSGSGTTAAGTAVDLGGTLSADAEVDVGNNHFLLHNAGREYLKIDGSAQTAQLGASDAYVKTNDGTAKIFIVDPSLAAAANGYVWSLVDDATGEGAWAAAEVTPANTTTLTNKRITQRVGTTASSATPTPDGDANDVFTVTALAAGATFAAPTGTPTDGQSLIIRVKDNGTARTLAFNAIYRASSDLALPTTTVISKTMYLKFLYNSADSKWDFVAFLNNF